MTMINSINWSQIIILHLICLIKILKQLNNNIQLDTQDTLFSKLNIFRALLISRLQSLQEIRFTNFYSNKVIKRVIKRQKQLVIIKII